MEIARVGVVGAGTMGAGIAQVFASAGLDVRLFDVSQEQLERSLQDIRASLERLARSGRLEATQVEPTISRVAGSTTLTSFDDVDFVVEAVPEDLGLKQQVFGQLERICSPGAILATNTSSLSVTEIAASIGSPERVVGMHFFNPPVIMPLVEVARAEQSAPESVQLTLDLARRLGKTPIEVADTPGFVVNRVARPFYLEALRIVGEGLADVQTVDRIARLAGFRMGPFELMDLIGIDVNYAVTQSIYDQTFQAPRFRPHPVQRQMVRANHLGRKTGRGFYQYSRTDGSGPAAGLASPTPPGGEMVGSGHPTVAILGEGQLADGLRQAADVAALQQVEVGQARLLVVASEGPLEVRRLGVRNALGAASERPSVLAHCSPYTVTEIASTLRAPERVVGFAIIGQVSDTKLVEVAAGHNTEAPAVDAAVTFFQALDKEPVQVGDGPGMVLARILSSLANEAAFALDDRIATANDIDTAMRLGTSYPLGPLEWSDRLGLDFVYQTIRTLQQDYGEDRYRPAVCLRRLVQAGRLGRKSGRGFFES